MLIANYTANFRRDIKKMARRGYDMSKLQEAMNKILTGEMPLPAAYKDHQLKGKWKYHRELHIEFDWVLVYAIEEKECFFTRTGTHSDLFDE